jgi:signal peptidase II
MAAGRRWTIVGLVAAGVLALDQLTKAWAVDRLKGQLPIHVIWTLQFNYAENTGMAFSKGTGAGRWISLVVLVIVVGLVLIARRVTSTVGLVLIGVVVGGAFGNLVDRVFRAHDGFLTGGVVDWIDVQWWPIFNVADAAVVVGGILVAIFLLREPVEDEPEPAVVAEADPEPPGGGA